MPWCGVRKLLFVMALSTVAYAEPTLEMTPKNISGPHDLGRYRDMQLVIENRRADYLKCYTDELANAEQPFGVQLHVTLIVTVDGKVTGAGAAGGNAKVAECVKASSKQLQFAKQPEKIQVDYAFSLSPNVVDNAAFGSLTGSGDLSSDEGGVGWGTIGTGTYGTIGHDSGSGSGYGVGRGGGTRGHASVPTVSFGQPNAVGDLDKAIIRRYIKRNVQKLQYCYEKQLLAKPGIKGTVTATFKISAEGTVASSSADGVDQTVSECVAGVIGAIEFPKPKDGGVVDVKYPLTFSPGEPEPKKPAAKKPAHAPK